MNVILRGREGSVVVAQSCHEGKFPTNTLSLSLVFVRVFFSIFLQRDSCEGASSGSRTVLDLNTKVFS